MIVHRPQLRSSKLARPQQFSLLSVPLLQLLLAAIWLGAPISAMRLLVCENGADSTTAVEAIIEASAAGAVVSRALIAALGWAPDVEPQLHRHDGRRLPEPVDTTQLQEGELIYLVRPGMHWLWPTGTFLRTIHTTT